MTNYIQPNQNKKTAQIVIWFYLATTEVVCICLDLFGSVITTKGGGNAPDATHNIDFSLIYQTIWFSVWVTAATAVWAICNLIGLLTNRMPKWLVSRNNDTMIVTEITIISFIYIATFVSSFQSIPGFYFWWQKTKSILEHFINPAMVIICYFVFADSKKAISSEQYAQKDGWWILLFVSLWLVYVVIRDVLLSKYVPAYADNGVRKNGDANHLPAFPYPEIDPYIASPLLWVPALFAFEFGSYGLGNLYNYLGNLACKSENKYVMTTINIEKQRKINVDEIREIINE